MRVVLADTFLMYSHAHIFHWNITGPSFFERHAFLNDLYTDLWGAVDGIAEQIRALGEPAPNSLTSIVAPANFADMAGFSDWDNIRVTLADENRQVIASLNNAFDAAEGNEGLRNFLADRLDRHAKWGWMLSVS
jgi:starvation-inducible DNA-binding protein